MVDLRDSTGLVIVCVTGTGIVVRLVNMVVFVRVTGTVEAVDSFVITVDVIGQVVVLFNFVVSIDFRKMVKSRLARESTLTLCKLCWL